MTRTDQRQELTIGVPFLEDKRAETITNKALETIDEWEIKECITSLSIDTTATNTGCRTGVCVRLQEEIGRNLIWFPCHDHVAELVLGTIVKPWEGSSGGPNVQLYDNFYNKW